MYDSNATALQDQLGPAYFDHDDKPTPPPPRPVCRVLITIEGGVAHVADSDMDLSSLGIELYVHDIDLDAEEQHHINWLDCRTNSQHIDKVLTLANND